MSIPNIFFDEFNEQLIVPFQQMTSRLQGRFLTITQQADRKRHDIEETREAKQKTQRHQKISPEEHNYNSRWTVLERFYDTALIDEDDEAYTKPDLATSQVANIARGLARKFDKYCIDSALGKVVTGKDGTSTSAFPSSQVYDATSGLTFEALVNTLDKLGKLEAEGNPEDPDNTLDQGLTFLVTQSQITNMLNDSKIQNNDTNPLGGRFLYDGRVAHYMGFQFVKVAEGLLPKVGGKRQCIAFHRRALVCAMSGEGLSTNGEKSILNSNSLVIRSTFRMGFARVLDEGVVRVDCAEA